MCKHLKYLVCIVVIMCITMSISMGVSATETISDSDYTKFVEMLKKTESGSGEDDNCNAIKLPDGSTFALFKFEKSSGNFHDITFNAQEFELLGDYEQKITLKNFEEALNASSISDQGKQYIYNEVRYSYDYDIRLIQEKVIDDVQPNMFLSYELFHPFSGVISTIVGCVCVVTLMSLVVTVVLDVMYMQFPVFREKTFQATQRGGGGRFSFIKNRTQIERPWFISYEAAYANKVNVESNGTRNALLIYLRYRALTFIVVAFCVVYLMNGMFVGIVSKIWDLFSPMFAPEIWGA